MIEFSRPSYVIISSKIQEKIEQPRRIFKKHVNPLSRLSPWIFTDNSWRTWLYT